MHCKGSSRGAAGSVQSARFLGCLLQWPLGFWKSGVPDEATGRKKRKNRVTAAFETTRTHLLWGSGTHTSGSTPLAPAPLPLPGRCWSRFPQVLAALRLRRADIGIRHHGSTSWGPGSWSENILKYFLRNNQIATEDGAEITWYHAANHKAQMQEALKSSAHMIEADVLLPSSGSEQGQPIMAHPPETNSDNSLQEWLAEVTKSSKGIKLDFKSLAAAEASVVPLENVKQLLRRPVWINADILPGPNGNTKVVDAKMFIDTMTTSFPDVTLSLGWTTGWHPEKLNEGYSWTMVKEMDDICSGLNQPVTFPVRAALVRQSCSQLLWLLQKSSRYSLTIWTGKDDKYSTEDLLYIREHFNKKQVFYDILEPQNHEFKRAIGIKVTL